MSGPPPDFVELAEDVSGSPLWNPDLAPTRLEQRTWSTYHIAALWIGMAVVITTYTLASGLMQQGMAWWQALTTILLGLRAGFVSSILCTFTLAGLGVIGWAAPGIIMPGMTSPCSGK